MTRVIRILEYLVESLCDYFIRCHFGVTFSASCTSKIRHVGTTSCRVYQMLKELCGGGGGTVTFKALEFRWMNPEMRKITVGNLISGGRILM